MTSLTRFIAVLLLLHLLLGHLLPASLAQTPIPTSLPSITAVAWHPNGSSLAVSRANGQVDIIDPFTQQVMQNLNPLGNLPSEALAWNPSGSQLAVAVGPTITIRDATTWQSLTTFQHPANVKSIAWKWDGSMIASADNDGEGGGFFVWNPLTQLASIDQSSLYATDIDWQPNGNLVTVTAGGAGPIEIWDASTNSNILTIPSGASFVAWTPNGSLIASSVTSIILYA
jgi:WD40 repeat protein